ncbi:hypothetical protein HMPREF2932_00565 [Corynebacterium sp. HMSC074H12]|nr:hypothetical protein HMPREF2932_00565 [Corynebacterium sp. HMSC074H12]
MPSTSLAAPALSVWPPRIPTPSRFLSIIFPVHTASGLIILVTSPAGAQVLSEVARSGEPAQLRGPQTTVHLSPTTREQRPVHDPKKGWAIPLSLAERETLSQLNAEPGDYEISESLAVSVELTPEES